MTDICVEKTCRCCLATTNPLFDMAATIILNRKLEISSPLLEEYLVFSSINADRNEKFMACKTCYRKLEVTFVFREICKKSNEVFQSSESKVNGEQLVLLISSPASLVQPIVKIDFEEAALLSPELEEVKSEPSDNGDHQSMDCNDADTENDSKIDVKKPIINTDDVLKEPPQSRALSKRKRGIKRSASPDYNTDLLGKDQTMPKYKPAEYHCLNCDNKYSYFVAIQQHRNTRVCHDWKLRKNWRDCAFCAKQINSSSTSYENHLSLQHPDYKPQRCTECSATFLSHYSLKNHLDMHVYGKNHQCLTCFRYFQSEKSLKGHISSVDHNSGGPSVIKTNYNCPYCGLAFDRITPLSEHITEKHPKKVYRLYFPCFWSKRIYFNTREYRRCFDLYCAKQKLEHDCKMQRQATICSTVTTFDCQKCDEKFYIQEELLCHEISFHSEIEERIFCNDCNEHFANQYEVRNHRVAVHPQQVKEQTVKKKIQCDECGLCYKTSKLLALHIMDHTMERPFKCDICEYSGKTEANIASHKRKRHSKTGQTKYKRECYACGKKYVNKNSVLDHLIYEHYPHMIQHKCDICGQTFASRKNKLKHVRNHGGEKPFKCTIAGCQNVYRTSSSLANHVQVKHTKIRYECKVCDAKLADKTNFWQHAFTHKGFYPFNCPACSYGCYQKYVFKPHLKNKHGIVYNDKQHGYHKETTAEVIATCLKVTTENKTIFSTDKMHYIPNMKYVVQKAMEMQSTEQQSEACASTFKSEVPYNQSLQSGDHHHFY